MGKVLSAGLLAVTISSAGLIAGPANAWGWWDRLVETFTDMFGGYSGFQTTDMDGDYFLMGWHPWLANYPGAPENRVGGRIPDSALNGLSRREWEMGGFVLHPRYQ